MENPNFCRLAKARLAAARAVLGGQVGQAGHAQFSKLQALAVIDLVNKAQYTAEELSTLSAIVADVPFAPDDRTAILTAMTAAANGVTSLPAGKRRRSQQNYLGFVNYFTDTDWDQLCDVNLESAAKLTLIIAVVLALGLRCPSEHTIKLLCSFYLVVTEDPVSLLRMDPGAKLSMLIYVKSQFQSAVKRVQDPPAWLERLPDTPMELFRDFPAVYTVRFGTTLLASPARVNMKVGGRY
jgi:hypothetical protein